MAGQQETLSELLARAPCAVETHDAEGREFLVRIAPLYDADGATSASIVEFADVSILKRALREREDLIRFISHDLRSPASSLLALAKLQRDDTRALEPQAYVARTEALAHRSLALAEGFLALARAEAIAAETFAVFELVEAIRDARDEVWALAVERDVRLELSAPDFATWVRGSRELLSRAITNLLTNAVKYSPRGRAVAISVSRKNEWLEVRVSDSGPGIEPAVQTRLFQRFQRLARARGQDPGGIGLGLAFVKLVAARHGGTVGVVSTPGQGSEFWLRVPYVAAPEEPPADPAARLTISADEPAGADQAR